MLIVFTPEDQEARSRQHRALADRRRIAEFAPLPGSLKLGMVLEHAEGVYQLDGDLSLFAPRDPFGPDGPTIRVTAVGDADAVRQASALIAERWAEVGRQLRQEADRMAVLAGGIGPADTAAEVAALEG